MDQSSSSSAAAAPVAAKKPVLTSPPRSFSVEFFVGIFAIVGVVAAGYLSVGLGGLELGASGTYEVTADFDNISGLELGATVEVAGVQVGTVERLYLTDPTAKVVMRINSDFKMRDDDIASIRTKGIIGDRYVKISRGGSDKYIEPGGLMTETESVVDIEDIIGKIVHSMTGEKDEEEKKTN